MMRSEASDNKPSRCVVKILRSGLFSTIQDLGRSAYRHLGVPVGGAMDFESLELANRLIGNRADVACLEFTLVGDDLKFSADTLLALVGADFDATLVCADGVTNTLPQQRPVAIRAGTVVKIGAARRACRGYLAVAGGFDVPLVLASRSTAMRSGFGGFHGRPTRAGDELTVGVTDSMQSAGSAQLLSRLTDNAAFAAPDWEVRLREVSETCAALRVLPGPDLDELTNGQQSLLFSSRLEITTNSDRMGYRLRSPVPLVVDSSERLSTGTVIGSVQLPPDGHPILLMADCAPTGGYPCVAVVIRADLPIAAQLRPGQHVSFECVSADAALDALRWQRVVIERAMVFAGLRM